MKRPKGWYALNYEQVEEEFEEGELDEPGGNCKLITWVHDKRHHRHWTGVQASDRTDAAMKYMQGCDQEEPPFESYSDIVFIRDDTDRWRVTIHVVSYVPSYNATVGGVLKRRHIRPNKSEKISAKASAEARQACARFDRQYKEGAVVYYQQDDGAYRRTYTCSAGRVLPSGRVMVKVECCVGWVGIERISRRAKSNPGSKRRQYRTPGPLSKNRK